GGQEDAPGRQRIALVPGARPDPLQVDLAREEPEGVLGVLREEVAELARGDAAGEEVLDVVPVVVGEGAAATRGARTALGLRPLAHAGREIVEALSPVAQMRMSQRPEHQYAPPRGKFEARQPTPEAWLRV